MPSGPMPRRSCRGRARSEQSCYRAITMSERSALFVRIPAEDAERLDRAAFELKASKQDLIAGLVARYVDPATAEGLESLRGLTEPVPLGRHEFRLAEPPAAIPGVLTPGEAGGLPRLGPAPRRVEPSGSSARCGWRSSSPWYNGGASTFSVVTGP